MSYTTHFEEVRGVQCHSDLQDKGRRYSVLVWESGSRDGPEWSTRRTISSRAELDGAHTSTWARRFCFPPRVTTCTHRAPTTAREQGKAKHGGPGVQLPEPKPLCHYLKKQNLKPLTVPQCSLIPRTPTSHIPGMRFPRPGPHNHENPSALAPLPFSHILLGAVHICCVAVGRLHQVPRVGPGQPRARQQPVPPPLRTRERGGASRWAAASSMGTAPFARRRGAEPYSHEPTRETAVCRRWAQS